MIHPEMGARLRQGSKLEYIRGFVQESGETRFKLIKDRAFIEYDVVTTNVLATSVKG